MGTREHKKKAPRQIKIGILTATSTRSPEEDKSGQWIKKRARKEKHGIIFHRIIPDDVGGIRAALSDVIHGTDVQVILINGGTGISRKDVTIEAVKPILDKELTAFGTLFTQLSFEEIDSAAMLSRACAGTVGGRLVFCMPGSLKACQLACKALIFPELGHLMWHVAQD